MGANCNLCVDQSSFGGIFAGDSFSFMFSGQINWDLGVVKWSETS